MRTRQCRTQDTRDPSSVVVAHSAQRAAECNANCRRHQIVRWFDAFVYIHAIAFTLWMLFVESDPWPKLTLLSR